MSDYIKTELVVSQLAFETDMTLEEAREVLENVPRADVIDRQLAIEAMVTEANQDGAYGYVDTKSVVETLSTLLSSKQEPSEDCISRKWVLNKIQGYIESDTTSTEASIGAYYCADFVKNAPSVVPTERTGK